MKTRLAHLYYCRLRNVITGKYMKNYVLQLSFCFIVWHLMRLLCDHHYPLRGSDKTFKKSRFQVTHLQFLKKSFETSSSLTSDCTVFSLHYITKELSSPISESKNMLSQQISYIYITRVLNCNWSSCCFKSYKMRKDCVTVCSYTQTDSWFEIKIIFQI
jgi:hypothetical protein